jgi:hypothetical protein
MLVLALPNPARAAPYDTPLQPRLLLIPCNLTPGLWGPEAHDHSAIQGLTETYKTHILTCPRKIETKSGIDVNHLLHYYSRMRFIYNLLPSLKAAEKPRVISILAGEKEGPIEEENLVLKVSLYATVACKIGFTLKLSVRNLAHFYRRDLSTPAILNLV